jgi:Mycothiol maleylpyruvate isomerase N-terminal domain
MNGPPIAGRLPVDQPSGEVSADTSSGTATPMAAPSTTLSARTVDLLPEWISFREAVVARPPDGGTACTAWTVRDVVAHQAGNAQELGRILAAHLAGGPVPDTRTFEEREPAFRSLPDTDLLPALDREVCVLADVLEQAHNSDPETMVPWTGRRMKVAWFAEHMREELILHRWDIVGDDRVGTEQLEQPWLTDHSVEAVGAPLLRRGLTTLGPDERVRFRIRSDDGRDVVVNAGPKSATLTLGPEEEDALAWADRAARVLLLWGRQPADPGRLRSTAGPDRLGAARRMLSGY